jgi:F-type H+-transporting ATPase subunit b
VPATLPAADAGLLDLNGTLVAELLAFLLMLYILARYAYPPIVRAAEARQKVIEEGLRAAEEAEKRLRSVQAEVEATLAEARAQAREVIARAHQEAAAEAEEVRVRGRRDAEAQIVRAREEIAAERDRALQEVRAQLSELVVEASSRVLGQVIDARAHQRLIDEALAEVTARDGAGVSA